MKSFAALASALFFAALMGCGGESENMSAQYPPPPPPGADAPEQFAAASEPPNAGVPQQMQGQAQINGEASAYAQPQQGDIQVGADPNEYSDTDPAALTDFKPALDPYGTWVDDPTYGTVWTPSPTVVGTDFAPYVTAGHWAYDDDYVWVSDYDWGWAPFHYGRWTYIGGRGWGWIPGRTYAGAWVTWRYGYDDWGYVGWAPMPPTWYWRGGYALGIGYVPVAPYVFCHSGYLFHERGVYGHLVTGAQVPVVASHTRPYVPANPGVGGGVGGHVGAHPSVGGPPPRSLGINNAPPPPAGNRALAHAQQFSKPSTATSLGAHAPAQYAQRAPATNNAAPHAFNSPSAYSGNVGGSQMRTTPTTLGQGQQHSAVASAPQYRGVSPTPHPAPYTGGSHYSSSAAAPSYHSSAPSYSAPHYSSPSYSAPHYSSPSSGSFHSSAPTYHAPTPSPSYHSAPSYHSSGSSGGGFHGGGGRSGGGRR